MRVIKIKSIIGKKVYYRYALHSVFGIQLCGGVDSENDFSLSDDRFLTENERNVNSTGRVKGTPTVVYEYWITPIFAVEVIPCE